nr:uncharacterized protein LOC108181536 [Danio rerio]|eukprot:XP_017209463.2 uncharacterized protein LOC108181536 [Danio rerio]
MATQAVGKSLEQLKAKRTVEKRAFTRLANTIFKTCKNMTEMDLQDSLNKLTIQAEKVMEVNDDLEAGMIAEIEANLDTDQSAELTEQQKDDLEKTASDCELKLDEVKVLLHERLWTRYGDVELSTALQVAEAESDRVEAVDPTGNHEAYDFMLSHLQNLIKNAKEMYSKWQRCIPSGDERDFSQRQRGLEANITRLVARKADFMQARQAEEARNIAQVPVISTYPIATIKLKPATLPKFSGSKRDFHRWKKDWEALQKQGEPTGSKEVKKVQLLDSLEEKIVRELRLTTYNSADDIFRVLENRYGNKTAIAIEIVEDLQKIPPIRSHQPRKIVELIQEVEKALGDLSDLGNTGAINNPLVTKSIEGKLPESLKKEWLIHVSAQQSAVTPDNRFDYLLDFLKKQENIYEQLEQLRLEEPNRKDVRNEPKWAKTKSTKSNTDQDGCVVCGDAKHKWKLYFCKQFRASKLVDKKAAVSALGACKKCLEVHEQHSFCKRNYLCKSQDCEDEGVPEHHYYLCPNAKTEEKRADQKKSKLCPKTEKCVKDYTRDQQDFLSRLSPELAQQCRNVFSNTTARVFNVTKEKPGLLAQSGLLELPVIMMLLNVTANAGQKIGTLIDLASDTNYITHSAADRLNLKGEKITLVIHGVGGMKVRMKTKRYLLKIRVRTSQGTFKSHQLACYGLESIAEINNTVQPNQLKKLFPDIPLAELARPKVVDLLISHREGQLAPQRIRIVGDLVLWEGPLGKTIGGTHPELFEDVTVSAYRSKTHFARSMRLAAVKYEEVTENSPPNKPLARLHESSVSTSTRDFLEWWKWDSIGAACEPKCGGCRCGNCQPGGKEMSLAEERELELVKEGLTYVMEDKHSNEPHWHAKYPWIQDPTSLPDNRRAVEATFLRTEKQLAKDPQWKAAYSAQVKDMLDRGAAVKLPESSIANWTGPVWYVSHLIAPNPHSVTTPVRLVWNSSQRFRGVSMNDLLIKGPDVLNQIRAVLLRFRSGVYAALGDIKKMYNSVWLEDQEVHLHRFLWRDTENEELGEYAITRVNIGDKPAGCIAQLAMRETANLPSFAHLEEERRVIQHDSYVDDILTSHNDLDQLQSIVANTELILKAGGFHLKPWVFSGQSGREKSDDKCCKIKEKVMVLPNQLHDDDNKALGLGYSVEDDKLYVMTSINFSKRKKKIRLGQNLTQEQVRAQTPNPLTRRELLSQVSGVYDPVGLVTPAKQKGAILVRRAFQEAKNTRLQVNETWDVALSDDLREDAIKLFEEYIQLGQIKFTRAITPPEFEGHPWAITFSDGSENTYGAVMYLRWDSKQGPVIRLVESKAKLTPLDQKGDAIKAEVCGAVFASRLRKYFEQHSRIQVERWFHLVDSQTVLGAIQRESYGYKTFFANRIGEIQGITKAQEWWWIPGPQNIADVITRGASPQNLDESSEWQNGPRFLSLPVDEWPIKSVKDLAITARESINKLQKKAFAAVLTRSKTKQKEPTMESKPIESPNLVRAEQKRPPAGLAVLNLCDIKRFSDLSRLVKTIAWVWRAAKKFLGKKRTVNKPKWEAVLSLGTISVREREDALRDIFLAEQDGVTFPNTTKERLVVFKDPDSGLLVCGGRVQVFQDDQLSVPILPSNSWISTLLARESHKESHGGLAETLLRMRRRAWVLKGRRIAQKVVDSCVQCRKNKAKKCQQVMGDLPLERTQPAAPFEFTAVDLFGPYHVKDDVKKRVLLKVWGVVFCCMSSRAIHTELVNSQSTEGFLLAFQRFAAIRGYPRKIFSDPGTNFIGARPVLQDLYQFLEGIDKSTLEETAVKHGTEWIWKIHPADSPHRNGAAEAAVRIIKRALQNCGGESTLTYSEMHTALQIAANLANERPIDARAQTQEGCIQYVTPNSLLLGRASQSGDIKTFDFFSYPFKRLQAMQSLVNKFWERWSQLAGPNLFIRSKWHTTHRNVAIGDIVWIADQNALRGQFKLGRVISVNPDSKGVVRDVNIRTFPSYPVLITKPSKARANSSESKIGREKIPSTVLHRDVRRLVVLLSAEEQKSK